MSALMSTSSVLRMSVRWKGPSVSTSSMSSSSSSLSAFLDLFFRSVDSFSARTLEPRERRYLSVSVSTFRIFSFLCSLSSFRYSSESLALSALRRSFSIFSLLRRSRFSLSFMYFSALCASSCSTFAFFLWYSLKLCVCLDTLSSRCLSFQLYSFRLALCWSLLGVMLGMGSGLPASMGTPRTGTMGLSRGTRCVQTPLLSLRCSSRSLSSAPCRCSILYAMAPCTCPTPKSGAVAMF
mmetsp:Transcript_55100/g.134884  ORF Transcript_55100/g.134884 Transcript_55100/m.134884 type:complete len:238 (+) Transcript_55100:4389-5102(+)